MLYKEIVNTNFYSSFQNSGKSLISNSFHEKLKTTPPAFKNRLMLAYSIKACPEEERRNENFVCLFVYLFVLSVRNHSEEE